MSYLLYLIYFKDYMQLEPKTSFSKYFKFSKFLLKIVLPILFVISFVYVVDQLDLPSPHKVIKKEISNEKLITIK